MGIIDFCWGGCYTILSTHAIDPSLTVDAAYAYHSLLVAIPVDFEPISKPIILAPGEKDSLLGEQEIAQLRGIIERKEGVERVRLEYIGGRCIYLLSGGIGVVKRIRTLWMKRRSRVSSCFGGCWSAYKQEILARGQKVQDSRTSPFYICHKGLSAGGNVSQQSR